jgi:hypothetical protein
MKGSENHDERVVPCLVGWHQESAEELERMWKSFLQELSESKDPREALDGTLLQAYAATESKEQEAAMIRYCERVWDLREPLVKEAWGRNYMTLFQPFFPERWAKATQYRERWLSYYLQNAPTFDTEFLRFAFGNRKGPDSPFNAVHFQQWQDYKERLSAAGKLSDRIRSICREYEADFFLAYLKPDPHAVAIPTVQVAQSWVPNPSEGKVGRKLVWQENLLWVVLGRRNDEIESEKQCYRIRICGLALPSFAVSQTIETPADLAVTESSPQFFLTPTSLFLKDRTRFYRYDRKVGTWSTLPLPESPCDHILARGDELIAGFSGEDKAVLRWSAATQKVELLASSRRRPATPTDGLLACTTDGFFGGENGKIGVILGYMGWKDGFYWFDPATGKSESPFGYFSPGYKVLSGSNTLLISRECGVAIIANETGVITQFSGSHFEKDGEKNIKDMPLVPLPEAFNSLPYKELGITKMPALAYSDGCLWTLRTRSDEMGHSLLLNRCERLDSPPSGNPDVRLAFTKQNSQPGTSSPLKPVVSRMPTEIAFSIAATPEGLVFSIFGEDGLWWMSYKDFDAAIAAVRKH